jgi:hypothetical protein
MPLTIFSDMMFFPLTVLCSLSTMLLGLQAKCWVISLFSPHDLHFQGMTPAY